jgi:hypothetical protein
MAKPNGSRSFKFPSVVGLFVQNLTCRRIWSDKLCDCLLLDDHVADKFCHLGGPFAGTHENQCLVLACLIEDFLVADFVHNLVSLDSLLLRNTDELLLEPTSLEVSK